MDNRIGDNAVKEAGAIGSTFKGLGWILLFAALAPVAVGGAAGAMYSNMTAPSDDDLEDVQTKALTKETELLTKRLDGLPPRKPVSTGRDVSWRGGFR